MENAGIYRINPATGAWFNVGWFIYFYDMGAKIAAFLLTLIANLAVGIAILFMMLIAMNGYSGSDAEWGLGAYVILAMLVSIAMSAGAVFTVHVLLKPQFSTIVSAIIAISVFSVLGSVLSFVSCLIGIGIAEYVRTNH